MTMKLLLVLSLFLLAVPAQADITFGGEEIRLSDIFDLEYAKDSNVNANLQNTSKYYCVFRSNWNAVNHPAEFPELARWGNPVLFSHYKEYAPFLKDRAAPYGVEQIAEVGFTDTFEEQIERAGQYVVRDSVEGQGFFINHKHWDDNFVYMPRALIVDREYSYISGIAGILPSPDWYTGFYLFDTLKEQGQTYWESFKIRTYPWDAGTDDGTHYEDADRDTDPPGLITRIELGDTEDNIFLSPEGDQLRYVAEWECVLHTCPIENPDCEKEDWPPANGCDILRFPECTEICDPDVEVCEQCRRETNSEGRIFRKDCCLAGRVPKDGRVCENQTPIEGKSGVSALSVTATLAVMMGLATLLV